MNANNPSFTYALSNLENDSINIVAVIRDERSLLMLCEGREKNNHRLLVKDKAYWIIRYMRDGETETLFYVWIVALSDLQKDVFWSLADLLCGKVSFYFSLGRNMIFSLPYPRIHDRVTKQLREERTSILFQCERHEISLESYWPNWLLNVGALTRERQVVHQRTIYFLLGTLTQLTSFRLEPR